MFWTYIIIFQTVGFKNILVMKNIIHMKSYPESQHMTVELFWLMHIFIFVLV